MHIGVGGGEIGLRFADIGPLRQQFGRQARRHARVSDAAQAAAADARRARANAPISTASASPVLPQCLFERRDRGALGVDQAFLLRGVERGRGAGIAAVAGSG